MKTGTKGKRISVVSGAILLAVLTITTWFFWNHIRFWWLFEPLGKNEQGYPEYRHRDTGIVMVRVPGGTFWMGSPEKEIGRDTRELQHEVTLSTFLIAKYEVTQAEWKKAMGSYPNLFEGDTFPAVRVSWEECQAFCQRMGLQFPTEAQWEYACRAGTKEPYAGTGTLDDMGWYLKNGGDRRNPVGHKKANGFGLYDTHGNVLEWCADVYDETFYGKTEARQKDPMCRSGSDSRVLRGGWYAAEARYSCQPLVKNLRASSSVSTGTYSNTNHLR